jgi:hypothetical protein
MQIILSDKEVKDAVAAYLKVKGLEKKFFIKCIKLRRKSPKTEDLGSILVYL